MLICEDTSFYIGTTNDVDKRFSKHVAGKGASYTRSHKPLKVVYREELADKSTALKREHVLKKLTHTQKLALI
nr:GIY-YIG nuclease family protein [Candidatus Woesebacteria bacterium]